MKRFLVLCCLLLASQAFAQEESVQFERANELYRKGDYREAAQAYEQIITNGYESAALYYNLGNAYFKLQNYPGAILEYERARRLAPHDDDILYNLRLVNLRVVDKIEPIPQLFLLEWWRALLNLSSSGGWAMAAIVSIWIAAFCGAVIILIRSVIARRIAFLLAALSIALCVFSGVAAYQRLREETGSSSAIVFALSVPVKSAPDDQSTDLFVLHEGVKVEFLDSVGEWQKIRLADGKVGWLLSSSVRVI